MIHVLHVQQRLGLGVLHNEISEDRLTKKCSLKFHLESRLVVHWLSGRLELNTHFKVAL